MNNSMNNNLHFRLSPIQNKTMDAFREVDLLVTTGSTNDKGLLKKVLENYYKADIQFGTCLSYRILSNVSGGTLTY